MTLPSDDMLLGAWKAGDRRAGNDLFQRHFGSVRRFFVNKTDKDVAELVQSTFARCIDAADRFEGRSSFRTFLFAIARNVLREHYRDRVRDKVACDVGDLSIEDMGVGPSTALAERREQLTLLRALRRIPMADQVILELYYWENLTAVQIGEIMEIPENTARSRIRSGKKRLKQAILAVAEKPEVAESTAGDLDGWAAKVRVQIR